MHPRVALRLGTEVGRDLSAAKLAREHDAVLWATATIRNLGGRVVDDTGAPLDGCYPCRAAGSGLAVRRG